MRINEFKVKHPAPSVCSASPFGSSRLPVKGISSCGYDDSLLGVTFRVQVFFLEGSLALIEAEPMGAGFEGGRGMRQNNPSLVPTLTDGFGPPKQFGRPDLWDVRLPSDYFALRWENGSSIAEYQDHMCGPWDTGADRGWGKVIKELLDGSYCSSNDDSVSYRQPVLLYVYKGPGMELKSRLEGNAQ
jgi:hypothetical protein